MCVISENSKANTHRIKCFSGQLPV